MAKIQPPHTLRKLTAAGYDACKQSLAESHPKLAAIVGDKTQLDRLEFVLNSFSLIRIEEQLNRVLSASLLPRDAFDAMLHVAVPSRRERVAADYLNRMNPTGTAEWVFEVFPEAKAHFCQIMLDAGEAEEMLRDLSANYNYTGIDPEEIPGFLSFINDFCKALRPLAVIQEKRAKAIAHENAVSPVRREAMKTTLPTPPKQAA